MFEEVGKAVLGNAAVEQDQVDVAPAAEPTKDWQSALREEALEELS